jgi:hypothetical protein
MLDSQWPSRLTDKMAKAILPVGRKKGVKTASLRGGHGHLDLAILIGVGSDSSPSACAEGRLRWPRWPRVQRGGARWPWPSSSAWDTLIGLKLNRYLDSPWTLTNSSGKSNSPRRLRNGFLNCERPRGGGPIISALNFVRSTGRTASASCLLMWFWATSTIPRLRHAKPPEYCCRRRLRRSCARIRRRRLIRPREPAKWASWLARLCAYLLHWPEPREQNTRHDSSSERGTNGPCRRQGNSGGLFLSLPFERRNELVPIDRLDEIAEGLQDHDGRIDRVAVVVHDEDRGLLVRSV